MEEKNKQPQKVSSYYTYFKFAHIMTVCVAIFIAVIVVSVATAVYKKNQLKDLRSQGKTFLECLKSAYSQTGNINSEAVRRMHYNFSRGSKLDIFVYDADGNCILSSDHYTVDANTGAISRSDLIDDDDYEPSELSQKMIDTINDSEGKYLELDSSTFTSKEPRLVYGTRTFVGVGNSISKTKLYAVFYEKPDKVNSFALWMTLICAAAALAAIYMTYILLRRRMRRLAAYENDFLKICEMYAKGDFTEKLRTDVDGTQHEIAQYVNALAAKIESKEDTSRTFIANVSHELRTPITTVGGFVDGILDGTIPKARQTEYLVIVSNEIKRLKILITSMLNMTKFESGTMTPNFRETNVTELVIKIVLMFEKKIEEKKLEVEGLDSDRFMAVVDADLMQQVIYNLVENAVKFINPGGVLSFNFYNDEKWKMISIKNTGEGLKDEEIQQVFDRFYKTDASRGKDTTGLGLGLSISRKIVHLHKGHIVVKSVYGEYTEFIIQLPRESKKDKNKPKDGAPELPYDTDKKPGADERSKDGNI